MRLASLAALNPASRRRPRYDSSRRSARVHESFSHNADRLRFREYLAILVDLIARENAESANSKTFVARAHLEAGWVYGSKSKSKSLA